MTDTSPDTGNVIPFPGQGRAIAARRGAAGAAIVPRPVPMRIEFASTVIGEHWYHEAAIEEDRKSRLKQ